MTIIHRYITGMFFKFFSMLLIVVIVIYLSIDLFGKLDNLMEAGLEPVEMLLFFVYKVPLIVSQITPVAVLLGVLVVFGIMSKNNEVLALQSSGVSLPYLLVPVLVIGLLLSAALFVFSEAVVPFTISRAHQLEEKKPEGDQVVASREKNIWLKHHRAITYIQYYHPSEKAIYGVSTLFFDAAFQLDRRIDAEKGVYEDGRWMLSAAMLQQFVEDAERPESGFYEEMRVDLPVVPADLQEVAQSAEEMSFTSLRQYVDKLVREGYDATRYRVDLYAKTAFPAICLIMSLMGAALALRGKTREGMAVSFAYGIVTAFVYWSLYSLCLSLGYGEILPPPLAAWMANLVFFCAAGWLVVNLD